MHSLPGMMEAIDKTRPGGSGASAVRYLRTPRGSTPRGSTPRGASETLLERFLTGDEENQHGASLENRGPGPDAGLGRTLVAKEAGCELAHNVLEKAIFGVHN